MPKNEDYRLKKDGRAKSDALSAAQDLRDSFKSPGRVEPTTAVERAEQSLQRMQNTIREEQMTTEQALQSCLAKASSHVSDSETIDALYALSEQLSTLVAGGKDALRGSPTEANGILGRLSDEMSCHQAKSDRQVAQALQKAVTALADAQRATFQSMSALEMLGFVKGAQQAIKETYPEKNVQ